MATKFAVALEDGLSGGVAWPSFALIASYELLMRQVHRAADASSPGRRSRCAPSPATSAAANEAATATVRRSRRRPSSQRAAAGQEIQLNAWRWGWYNRAGDGSLPSGKEIARQYGRHERWGRLVKHAGLAGELSL
jgi:hypothetical protein